MTKYGEWVKLKRKEKGLTLEQLAIKSGTGKSQIWEIENTNANPRLSTLINIASGLGVKLTYSLKKAGY